MINEEVLESLENRFREHFGGAPRVVAYAPGRVEVLGNHTDYNEGFVLSAAINLGTFFVAAPCEGNECRLVAADIMDETRFDVTSPAPVTESRWSNYVRGVLAGLRGHNAATMQGGFHGMFLGNIPLGSGLSSSAALEMSAGLALAALYDMDVERLDLARIGQSAEHHFAGVKCGLLDQISSLYGRADHLVMSDFRSLDVETVPLGHDTCFLMCNTHVKHALVDGEYNERRRKCEEAATYFAAALPHPVQALRDVSAEELAAHRDGMDTVAAKRAAHVIGENTRVLEAKQLLQGGRLERFGQLMFESHDSSRHNFENSCDELDFVVDTAARTPGVLGARLSGGGFGGSAVILVHPRDVSSVSEGISGAFAEKFHSHCDIRVILPSAGGAVQRK
jgi:galactokinase